MRTRLLTVAAVMVGSALLNQANASGDDSCYPSWTVLKENLDACSNLPFLSPGNDSEVNLRLLLADKGLNTFQLSGEKNLERDEGFGAVPFSLFRFGTTDLAMAADNVEDVKPGEPTPAAAQSSLTAMLEKLGLTRAVTPAAGDEFLSGEGSRCRSNADESAQSFISQVLASKDVTDAERKALADSRMQMLGACTWDADTREALQPKAVESVTGKAFATYLRAASAFYNGNFDEALTGFTALSDSPQPWLKQTAVYMTARTKLNSAQEDVFDEYSQLQRDKVDKAALADVETSFKRYLDSYPDGDYADSAQGLLRRVHWLAGDDVKLGEDYAWQLEQQGKASADLEPIVIEMDRAVLGSDRQNLRTPWMLAITDLIRMRETSSPRLSEADLKTQEPLFAEQPELYRYLQGALALYVLDNPDQALEHLPTELPEHLDYLTFSQHLLRGLALQTRQDFKGAQTLWLEMLPRATQPLQREQLELALAMSFERDEQLSRVFAADSPIRSAKVRYILLSRVADADLLRRQTTQGLTETERNAALFVLLYKDLMRNRYADFAEDLKRLPEKLPEDKLGYALGYTYEKGPSLSLFQWPGSKAESDYTCPAVVQTAAALNLDAKDPKALNCMGEFIRANSLDGMPLDSKRNADTLGGSAPGFSGEVFSRLEGYKAVIGNPKAPRDEKAYALYRAVNCYGPSGYNTCGGKEVEPSVRKGWFRQLKKDFASTQWGQTQQYYW
ncbi:outer membrane assembly lipoprotein YfiO [Pseudomonas alliivorans]|uniref:tetratricopeptide repeat protein n=1 Tax=Pseudomonas alliivorans TaxID=2810613 RepID=UPI00211C893C|nr:outer membrane assembly lipoprotein YfiO [Pseudomonas alliivorans]MCQ9472312.1 outer membrane assembly lipoprotein YfiO [Pseudomonas alliivorans]